MPSLAGETLDKYDMLEEVGHGGMAVVYRGRDRVLDREVAVKVLHPHLADRAESKARLRREAITVAKLRHDNILEIFDYSGQEASESYIVTEFIHGVTLRDWLDSRWQPRPALAALVVHRLCLALAHAHEFGIVHRDIKPENVMIRQDGCLKLMDFGIAQILDHQKLTMTGQLLGSPAYMAPELISGKPIDSRTDLFSVGILLYQLSTGQLPFSGRNPHEVLNRIADADYSPASAVNPMVDPDLEDLLKRALAREPDHRYQTARALANDLEDYLDGMGIEPTPGEIHQYFKDSEKYVDELDERVCAHLMEQAEKANREGHSARALGLLGRVIELDPENRRAKELIDNVRRRGKVMRQALLGVGTVALLGLVGAGVLLMQPGPPVAENVEDEAPKKKHHKAPPPTIPDQPPVNEPDVIVPAGETGQAAGETGQDTASGETGEVEPANVGTPRETTGGVRPKKLPYSCTITVERLPAAQRRKYSLQVGSGPKSDLDASGNARVQLPAKGGMVNLRGPPKWKGSWKMLPTDCPRGAATKRAQPSPAKIKFNDLDPALQRPGVLVLRCKSGCDQTTHYDKFKPIQFKADEDQRKVVIELEAKGWDSKTIRPVLGPGENPMPAGLKKLK
jgi:serine/threonine-protein kinase